MASFDYQEMIDVVEDLLTEFGNPFILKKPYGSPKYDSKTKSTEQQFKDYTGVCVMKTYEAEAIGMFSNIINAGDVSFKCKFDDTTVIPNESKDKLIYGNATYNILDVATSNPSGDNVIIHTIHCRKA